MKHKKMIVLTLALLLVLGMSVYGYQQQGDDMTQERYSVSNREMMDTYIIAAALSMDFKSSVLLPNSDQHKIYMDAKLFFEPFKDHEFIKNMGSYTFYDDINGDAIGVLLSYDDSPELNRLYSIDKKYRQGTFKTDEAVDQFIKQLKSFYEASHASEYFEQNRKYKDAALTYCKATYSDTHVDALLNTLESIVDVKNGERVYESIITLYRPSMASFYSLNKGKTKHLIAFESPNDYSRNPYKLDVENMIASAVHEFIHADINENVERYVKENYLVPMKLTDNRMYNQMPMHRQVDEYLVRGIEGYIYAQVFDEERAYNQIMNKETMYGGFPEVGFVYEQVKANEQSNQQLFEAYLPSIIDAFMNKIEKKMN